MQLLKGIQLHTSMSDHYTPTWLPHVPRQNNLNIKPFQRKPVDNTVFRFTAKNKYCSLAKVTVLIHQVNSDISATKCTS